MHEQYNESESEIRRNTSSQSPSVVIVGDYMIKHLDKRRLQRSIKSEIIISQIVNRTDKAGMTKKITEVNKLARTLL